MATARTLFDRKPREAQASPPGQDSGMINRTMSRADWGNLLLLAVIWGGAFFFIDIAVAEVAPMTFVWLRLTFAAAALWLFLALRGQPLSLPLEVLGAMAVLAFLNNALPFTLFAWAQTSIDGGLASILNATSPLWSVLLAHYLTTDEPMTVGRVVGVLIGLAGVIAMIGPDLLTVEVGLALAEIACIAAAMSYALAGVWARRFRKLGIRPTTVAAWQLALSAAMMLPMALIVDKPWLAAMPSPSAWAAIFALAIVCSAFAYIIYFQVIERAGATNALLVTILTPPVAILLGALFLSEQLGPRDFVGLGLIGIGLATIDGRLVDRFRQPRSA